MVTSIQISERLQNELSQKRIFDREPYEEIIWDLIEDSKELNKQTKEEIARSRAEIKAGKFYKLSEIKKEVGLDV